jgi:hypothetical protein
VAITFSGRAFLGVYPYEYQLTGLFYFAKVVTIINKHLEKPGFFLLCRKRFQKAKFPELIGSLNFCVRHTGLLNKYKE